MGPALTTEIILQSVGKQVINARDEYLGEIIEIFRNNADGRIEYAVLKSNQLFDQEDRFFAIPVSSTLMKITEAGGIVLLTSKDELHHANAITPDQCPTPNFHAQPGIFELFECDSSENAEPLKREETILNGQ